MAHNADHCEARQSSVTLIDLEEELCRLIESKILLVALADKVGMAVPRSCCIHQGENRENPCLSCASDWLVAHVRFAKGAVN
jgi:hypothetical protein